ncbi:MAG: YfcE family phosphodiesterase [Caldilineae bacterium]|nr:YfcE family phosphodiesterase [Anaerolineae bacterium]MCB0199632.1 YfcE family phosphodiesterase [Anaerolineae bacterium]MCB0204066.1 YfcE family phosphodiesterase [Anaerolineae bacterium]MCB9154638.1 YfcE family phosphodiesterase [Caldilineae bacterium]
MIIAVMSDVHDNVWNLADALKKIGAAGASSLLFCGDFCAPFTLAQIGQDFSGEVHCVFGNNDGDPRLLMRNAAAAGNVTIHGQYAELELGGRRIAVNHYPEIARRVAEAGQFDLVCYGHNHRAHVELVGGTVLANPGEVMGRFGRPTFGLYDCESGDFSLHDVKHFPATGGSQDFV